jgi:chromosome segregation ATPase
MRMLLAMLLGALLAGGALAQQTKPTISDADRARLRDLQYQMAKIDAQMMQLQVQFQQIQLQAQQLQKQREELSKQFDDEIKRIEKSVDLKQWRLDTEKLEFEPVKQDKQ